MFLATPQVGHHCPIHPTPSTPTLSSRARLPADVPPTPPPHPTTPHRLTPHTAPPPPRRSSLIASTGGARCFPRRASEDLEQRPDGDAYHFPGLVFREADRRSRLRSRTVLDGPQAYMLSPSERHTDGNSDRFSRCSRASVDDRLKRESEAARKSKAAHPPVPNSSTGSQPLPSLPPMRPRPSALKWASARRTMTRRKRTTCATRRWEGRCPSPCHAAATRLRGSSYAAIPSPSSTLATAPRHRDRCPRRTAAVTAAGDGQPRDNDAAARDAKANPSTPAALSPRGGRHCRGDRPAQLNTFHAIRTAEDIVFDHSFQPCMKVHDDGQARLDWDLFHKTKESPFNTAQIVGGAHS